MHKSNTQTHSILGEFLMDRPGNSLWTKITCSRQHLCHHRQSGVATRVCLEKGKAESQVMETGGKKCFVFFEGGFLLTYYIQDGGGCPGLLAGACSTQNFGLLQV